MIVQVKVKWCGKYIYVFVTREECPKYNCFVPHKYEHRGTTIDGKSNNWTDNFYSCANNNYRGCPDHPK